MTKIEQDIKDIKEALCIIRHYGACDLRVEGVDEASERLTEITDKWESEAQDAEDEKSIDYELGYEKGWADGYAEGMEE